LKFNWYKQGFMSYLTAHPQGTRLALHIQPRASRTAVVCEHGGRLKIALAAPPVDGKANAELCKFIAKLCGVSKSSVVLLSGETGRQKDLLVAGMSPEAVAAALGLQN
jgi:uncharacterized protein (TIGR00251 family)